VGLTLISIQDLDHLRGGEYDNYKNKVKIESKCENKIEAMRKDVLIRLGLN